MSDKSKKHKKNRRKKSSRCPHCYEGNETFRWIKKLYLFDVDLAREIVDDDREVIELEPDDVQYSVDECRIYQQHLAHVDVQYPGIIAHYWYPEQDGTVSHGHVLIDGHHRAARTLELGIPYFVKVLTEEESRRVMLITPDIDKILSENLGIEEPYEYSAS